VGKWTGGAISGVARSGTSLLALHGRTSSDAPSMADSAMPNLQATLAFFAE
jgi:hypothetical protein